MFVSPCACCAPTLSLGDPLIMLLQCKQTSAHVDHVDCVGEGGGLVEYR